jgi:DNA-binding transcriptional regulator YdaS (Cro superfamily)
MTLSIERATQGLVTRNELRPDLYPVDAEQQTA